MRKSYDIKRYTEVKKKLKEGYMNERLGNQQTYDSQSRLFKPIIDATKQTSENLGREIASNLIPLSREMRRNNDTQEFMQRALEMQQAIRDMSGLADVHEESTPKPLIKRVDLDKGFDTKDFENLNDLSLDHPSDLLDKLEEIPKILKVVSKKTKSLAQEFRQDRTERKSDSEREVYQSRKATLEKYKNRLKLMLESENVMGEGLAKRKLVKRKQGRGRPKTRDTVYYKSFDELIHKLSEYIASFKAGNNSLHNAIIDVMDELLENRVISKEVYDEIYQNTF